MGYMFCYGDCLRCRRRFGFNPDLVPSMRIRWEDGKPVADPSAPREPLCADCVNALNEVRKAQGMDPFTVAPGAYEPTECV